MTTMQEELGSRFTSEMREAWRNAVLAITEFASK